MTDLTINGKTVSMDLDPETPILWALRDTLALVLDDLTQAEVGEILGVSEGTIAWRVSEAKKRLREIREKEEAT